MTEEIFKKPDIRSYTPNRLSTYVTEELNEPSYRANQLFRWFHQKCAGSYGEMTSLPKSLREYLTDATDFRALNVADILTSKKDGTKKFLFKLEDNNFIESVFMRHNYGNSVCVSSQAGCAMGCKFCASTKGGLIRNLSSSEILSQVYEIQKNTGERVSNIVVMGMGEPLANYTNVMNFVRIITDENALHISRRNITISTCGLVPEIKKAANESLGFTLALSLHAPNDELRRRLMPIAKKYTIEETLDACDKFFNATGRRVTFEYCLIKGVNSAKEQAKELAALLKGKGAHVNLIGLNETDEGALSSAGINEISEFKDILERAKISVTVRRSLGSDIKGACGQLAGR